MTDAARVAVGGVDLDPVTLAEAAERVVAAAAEGRGGIVVTPNVDHLHRLAANPMLAPLYEGAALVLADGMPLVWAARLQGTPLPERVAGSDLVPAVAAVAEGRVSLYLAGGPEGAAQVAAEVLRRRHPRLDVRGWCCPRIGADLPAAELFELERSIADAEPDIVLLGFGAPKQERLAMHLATLFPAVWFLCVGAAIEMGAGQVARAPGWAQTVGAEWVVRLAQEPFRLAHRYLVDDLPFAVRLLAGAAARRRARESS